MRDAEAGIGMENAFSVGAKTIALVALMPPSSCIDNSSQERDIAFLDARRSQDTPQHMILQEKVFNSVWFHHPRLVRQLLSQLTGITLDSITVSSEATKTLEDMRKRYPDFVKLGQGRGSDARYFNYIGP